MSKPVQYPRPINILMDRRSTGAPPRPTVPDILGLRGTLKR
jgi:hypothetical protein